MDYEEGMPQWFTGEQVEELIEAAVLPLRAEIAELMAQVERLQAENARLKKDSSNRCPISADEEATAGAGHWMRGGPPRCVIAEGLRQVPADGNQP